MCTGARCAALDQTNRDILSPRWFWSSVDGAPPRGLGPDRTCSKRSQFGSKSNKLQYMNGLLPAHHSVVTQRHQKIMLRSINRIVLFSGDS